MHAVVLAAGFGSRLGAAGMATPKPLLPLKRGVVLDAVVTSVWVPGITCVNVVHNDHRSRKRGHWPRLFRRWKNGVSWSPEPGKNREAPYIKLSNNGVHDERLRNGAVGDLAFAIRGEEHPLLVVCGDDLFKDSQLEELKGETSSIVVRSTERLHALVLDGNPSKVRVDAGKVFEIGPDVPDTPWRYCGAMYIAAKDMGFVKEYAETWKKADVIPDALDGLLDSMVADGREVRAVKTNTRFWSVGTPGLYEHLVRVQQTPSPLL